MFRPASVFIGLRYTRARRRGLFVSFVSLTSILGMALGVAVMILIFSVMNGFDHEMRSRVLGMVPQLSIDSFRPIDDWRAMANTAKENPQVLEAAPFIQLQGMISSTEDMDSVLVSAIEPAEEARISIINQYFQTPGKSLDLLRSGEFGIIIGSGLASKLGVSVGDRVTFILPEVSITPAGAFPRMKRFTVAGIFHVGAGEVDGHAAFIHIVDAARLKRWKPGQVEGIRLTLHDLFQAQSVGDELIRRLDNPYLYPQDWMRTHGGLYQAIIMAKDIVGLLLVLIVLVAAFNIVSTLVMVVNDKRSDIAILRTIGFSPAQIMRIFMVQGVVIGVLGTLSGLVLGVLAAGNASRFIAWVERISGHQFLNPEVYFIDYLPSQIQVGDTLVICIVAFLLSFLATLYPSWRAARTQPAETLRYE